MPLNNRMASGAEARPNATNAMTSVPPILRRIALAYAVAAVAALVEALAFDVEALPAALLLSLITLPSIAGYVLSARAAPTRPWHRHLWFLVPALLVVVCCVYLMVVPTTDAVVHDIGLVILTGYLPQIIPAYFVLIASAPRQTV
jgi:hypothetical protein